MANLVTGVLIALSLLAYGLDAAGCLSIGAAFTLTGLTFTGVALVAAQLTDGARAMYGITGAVIAVSYALRAIGDVSDNGLSWLSPIGWGQAMHPFSGERWWPALLPVVASVALVGAALALFVRRDVGSGLWPSRPGPGRASSRLLGTLGLAWRLQRGSIIGWTTGSPPAGHQLRLDRQRRRGPDGQLGLLRVDPERRARPHRLVLCLRDRDDGDHRVRLHHLLRPAAARRGGCRPRRERARDRAAAPHLAPGSRRHDGARHGSRCWWPAASASVSASRWSPATGRPSGATSARCCRTSPRCSCSERSRDCCTASCRRFAFLAWVGLAF